MINSHFNHVPFDVLYSLFKTYCMPLYSSQIWDFTHKSIDRFLVTWRKAIRKIFSLPYNTHCILLPYICDYITICNQLYKRVVSFLSGIRNSPNNITKLCYKLAVQGSCSAICNNITYISHKFATSRYDTYKLSIPNTTVTDPTDIHAIHSSIIRDLLYIIHINKYNHTFLLDNEEIMFMLQTLCTE